MFLKSTIKFGLGLVFVCLFTAQSMAQGGLAITAGFAGAKNHLEEVSPKSAINSGYAGAAEARFLGQDMYFVVQLMYAKYKLLSEKGIEFPSTDNNFQVGHGRIGMGFTLARFGYNNILRAKILGSLDKTIEYTTAKIAGTDYSKMNDSTVGMLLGVGIDLKWFVIDVEYQRGLINAFYKKKGSNFDYFSIRTGILIN